MAIRGVVTRGYMVDDTLLSMLGEASAKPEQPIMNRGYYARMMAIERLVGRFARACEASNWQLISLGAGLDTLYFRLRDRGIRPASFIEVDFAEVIQHKLRLLKQSGIVESQGGEVANGSAREYQIVSADLRDPEEVKASVLSSRCEIRYDIPTIVIAECVLVYMEPDRSEELLKWVANAFREGCCALYEQIRPDDPFGRQMVEKLRSHGRALRGISATPSLKAQARRLARVGWERAGAMDMLQAYNSLLTAEDRRRAEAVEHLDEFEEWNLLMGHYCVAVGAKGGIGNAVMQCADWQEEEMGSAHPPRGSEC